MSFLAFRENRGHSHLLKSMVIECLLMITNPLFLYSVNRYLNSLPCAGYRARVEKVMPLRVGTVHFKSSCLPLLAFGIQGEVAEMTTQERNLQRQQNNHQPLTS